jgi:pyruvate-formate lyase
MHQNNHTEKPQDEIMDELIERLVLTHRIKPQQSMSEFLSDATFIVESLGGKITVGQFARAVNKTRRGE